MHSLRPRRLTTAQWRLQLCHSVRDALLLASPRRLTTTVLLDSRVSASVALTSLAQMRPRWPLPLRLRLSASVQAGGDRHAAQK
jgi:hypothetical protein